MSLDLNRRCCVLGAHMTVLTVTASPLLAHRRSVWSAEIAFDLLLADTARIIDLRTRDEWQETGVGAGVCPIGMHKTGFPDRLFKAQELIVSYRWTDLRKGRTLCFLASRFETSRLLRLR